MFPKLPLALALLLSAASLAAAELRTEVPYYMVPFISAIGSGVAPAAGGNEECPSAVIFTPEVCRGVPIIFSAPQYPGKSVAIDENTVVFIRFNASVHGCQLKTWGNRYSLHMPKTVPIVLLGSVIFETHEPIYFKVRNVEQQYYTVTTEKQGEDGIYKEYRLMNYYDKANDVIRLAITNEYYTLIFFSFPEAKDEDRMIKSVV